MSHITNIEPWSLFDRLNMCILTQERMDRGAIEYMQWSHLRYAKDSYIGLNTQFFVDLIDLAIKLLHPIAVPVYTVDLECTCWHSEAGFSTSCSLKCIQMCRISYELAIGMAGILKKYDKHEW